MRKFCSVLGKILSGIVGVIGIAVLSVAFGLNLFYTYNAQENPAIVGRGFDYLISVAVFFALLIILLLLRRRFKAKAMYICFGIVYLICGLYLIFYFKGESGAIASREILQASTVFGYPIGILSSVKNAVLIFFASKLPILFYCVNLVSVLLINFLVYKITDIIFNANDIANVSAILLSFGFITNFFVITVFDFRVIGLAIFLTALYFEILYHKNREYGSSLFAAVFFAVLAVLLDFSFFIALTAIVVFEIVVFFRECGLCSPVKRILIFLLSLIIVTGVLCFALSYYDRKNNSSFESEKVNFDTLDKFKNDYEDSANVIEFLKNKLVPIFGDHTFGRNSLVAIEMKSEENIETENNADAVITPAYEKYDWVDGAINNWMDAVCILILLFAIVEMVIRFNQFHYFGMSALIFISGLVLLTLVNAGSYYACAYMIVMIPVAAGGVAVIGNPIFDRDRKYDYLKNVIEDKRADMVIREAQRANEERKNDVIMEEADKAVAEFEERNKAEKSETEFKSSSSEKSGK